MSDHEKVYGICENKCFVELLPKEKTANENIIQLLDSMNIEVSYFWASNPDDENDFTINNLKRYLNNELIEVSIDSDTGELIFTNVNSAPKNKMFTVVGQFKNYSDTLDEFNYTIRIDPQDYGLPTSGSGFFYVSAAVFGKPSDFVPVA